MGWTWPVTARGPYPARLLDAFNLILSIEHSQKEALLVEFPHLEGKVFLLGEMAGSSSDVEDPYDQHRMADYEAAAREISAFLLLGLEKILHLASHPGA